MRKGVLTTLLMWVGIDFGESPPYFAGVPDGFRQLGEPPEHLKGYSAFLGNLSMDCEEHVGSQPRAGNGVCRL